jgi:hypothetical protein
LRWQTETGIIAYLKGNNGHFSKIGKIVIHPHISEFYYLYLCIALLFCAQGIERPRNNRRKMFVWLLDRGHRLTILLRRKRDNTFR